MPVYLGIEFAKDYNKSFAEFKEEFGSNHIFNEFPPKQREQELNAAYKIATSKAITRDDILTPELISEIEVLKAETVKPDGHTSRTVNKSKEHSAG
jgi:hypothetical protein